MRKKGIKYTLLRTIFISLLFICATSCQRDDDYGGCDIPLPQSQNFELQLNIVSDGEYATRSSSALTSSASEAELEIKNGYLFVFDKAGAYRNHGLITTENLATTVTGNKTKKPTLSLNMAKEIGSNEGQLAVAVNADDHVVLILNQDIVTTTINISDITKSDISTHFPLESKATKGFRPDLELGNSAILGIPMYGEALGSDYTTIFTVTRAVAKIQVKLGPKVLDQVGVNGVGHTHFSPENVKYQIFHNALTGVIARSVSPAINYSKDNAAPIQMLTDAEAMAQITKSVTLSSVNDNTTNASYIYEFPHSTKIVSVKADAEEPKTTVLEDMYQHGRLAILLRVKQDDVMFRYYHLSLYDKTTKKYLDVERNHNYQIIINSVNDAGYTTAEKALTSHPNNIDFDIIDNQTGKTTMSNGEYAISINPQMYGGDTVYMAVDEGRMLRLSDGVKYILSPSLEALPKGIINKITCIADPEGVGEELVTISPIKLTSENVPLVLSIPTGYTGKISYKIELGDMLYESKKHKGDISGTSLKDLSVTIEDWTDDPANGDIGAGTGGILTVPSKVLMTSKESGNIEYRGGTTETPEEVSIYLPTSDVGSDVENIVWGDAVTTSADFATKFTESPKQSWLTAATIDMSLNTSGHFTFTVTTPAEVEKDDLEPYYIRLQSGGTIRIMKVEYRATFGYGIDMKITPATGDPYWITIADRNVGVDMPTVKIPSIDQVAGTIIGFGEYDEPIWSSDWYGEYYLFEDSSACKNWEDINGVDGWRLPSPSEWRTLMAAPIHSVPSENEYSAVAKSWVVIDKVVTLDVASSNGNLRENASKLTSVHIPMAGVMMSNAVNGSGIISALWGFPRAILSMMIDEEAGSLIITAQASDELSTEDMNAVGNITIRCVRNVDY